MSPKGGMSPKTLLAWVAQIIAGGLTRNIASSLFKSQIFFLRLKGICWIEISIVRRKCSRGRKTELCSNGVTYTVSFGRSCAPKIARFRAIVAEGVKIICSGDEA